MGVSMAKVTSVSTNSLSSNKITLQAHQLASDKAEFLKSETYSSLASQGKKSVTGSLYYDEVTVGKETSMPSNMLMLQGMDMGILHQILVYLTLLVVLLFMAILQPFSLLLLQFVFLSKLPDLSNRVRFI